MPSPSALRAAAAAKYRPSSIDLLIVAEAPPCTPGRYFYFEHVDKHDWLFRYVCKTLHGQLPDRTNKPHHLARLKSEGVFLIDLAPDGGKDFTARKLAPLVPALITRCRELAPKRIAMIKATVYDTAYPALASAGLPVIDERIPFPASGQQLNFERTFARAVTMPRTISSAQRAG